MVSVPKPPKREKQKRNRERDDVYLKWIHGFPCVVCGKHPVDAHHVVTKARLGSDRTCLPFCHYHHLSWIHGKGQKTSQEAWGISFDELVKEFNQKFDSGVKGPFDHLT